MGLNFGSGLFPQRNDIQAVYNFKDIESGTGVVTFYAIKELKNNNYRFVENNFDITTQSDNIEYSGRTDNDSTLSISVDTEIFKIAKTINGKAFIKLAVTKSDGAGDMTISDITLEKIDALDSSTDLTTGFTFTVGAGDTFGGSVWLELGNIENQVIKVGEKIRLTMTIADTSVVQFYHNPGGTDETERTMLQIPFKIFQ